MTKKIVKQGDAGNDRSSRGQSSLFNDEGRDPWYDLMDEIARLIAVDFVENHPRRVTIQQSRDFELDPSDG